MDIWDIVQQGSINALRRESSQLASNVEQQQESSRLDVQRLEERIDRLALICRAMHELLRQNGHYDDRILGEKILEIDVRDGRRDGRYTAPSAPCPQCGAMISPKFNRCLFCGYEDRTGSPFHSV